MSDEERQKEEIEMSLPIKELSSDYYASGFPKVMVRGKYNMKISERLRQARAYRGYSLAQVKTLLSKRGIETGRSTIQGYEVDEDNLNHRYPSLHMLLQIANVYDCSLDYVFGVSDEINRPTNDLLDTLSHNEKILWKGQEITEGQRGHIVEMIDKIMEITV